MDIVTYALSKKYTDKTIAESGGGGDYLNLQNKPSINGVELTGNKTSQDLNINVEANFITFNINTKTMLLELNYNDNHANNVVFTLNNKGELEVEIK